MIKPMTCTAMMGEAIRRCVLIEAERKIGGREKWEKKKTLVVEAEQLEPCD